MKSKAHEPDQHLVGVVRQRYDERDRQHWQELERLIAGAGLSLADVLKHYPAFIRRRDLPRLLCHYELFKLIADLPGSIAELGVFRGSGFFTWANLLESFCPGDRTRKVYGFDHFGGYAANPPAGEKARAWVERVVGDMVSDADFIQALTALHNRDNLLPDVERCRIIEGDIGITTPAFVAENPGLRLALLYFDTGLYESTRAGLEHLYPLVMTGGIVVFNGYGMPPWDGEAKAIEEFFGPRGGVPAMRKFAVSTLPHAYFVKGPS